MFKVIFYMGFASLLILVSCSEIKDSSVQNAATFVCPNNHSDTSYSLPGSCSVCQKQLVKQLDMVKASVDAEKELSANSVLRMGRVWVDQNRDSVQLKDFLGKYILTTMVFTGCEYACPNIIGDIKAIEEQLDTAERNNLNVVLVTFDYEKDTPEVLREYASQPGFGLDQSRWKFLYGNKDNIFHYSTYLGITYKRFESGAYGHSNSILLLNKKGEIVYQLDGIHTDNKELVTVLKRMIQE